MVIEHNLNELISSPLKFKAQIQFRPDKENSVLDYNDYWDLIPPSKKLIYDRNINEPYNK